MDLKARKLEVIQEILRINNEQLLEKLENFLHQQQNSALKKNQPKMTMKQLDTLIDKAEADISNNRLHSASDILKDIDRWK